MRHPLFTKIIHLVGMIFIISCQSEPRSLQNEYANKPTVLQREVLPIKSITIDIPPSTYPNIFDDPLLFGPETTSPSDSSQTDTKNPTSTDPSSSIYCSKALSSNANLSLQKNAFKLTVDIESTNPQRFSYFFELNFQALCQEVKIQFQMPEQLDPLSIKAILFFNENEIAQINSSLEPKEMGAQLTLQP